MQQKIDGVLLLNKVTGLSSNRALQQIKCLFRANKAGHTGTLDPLATGLLPICFGEATKFARYLMNADKIYLAGIKFGKSTTTGDQEGKIVLSSDVVFSRQQLLTATQQFIGIIKQTPPMFSAIKHAGVPLYQYARTGITIQRTARQVEIYAIDIIDFQFPCVVLKIHCSKGTYIRTLAEDLAKDLGTVAYLETLSRIQTHRLKIENAHSFEKIQHYSNNALLELLMPVDTLVSSFDKLTLSSSDERKIKNGRLVQIFENYGTITNLALYSVQNNFIGLGVYVPNLKAIKALRLMHTLER